MTLCQKDVSMAQIRASAPSARSSATWTGIVGGVIASSSIFLPVLIGIMEPHCSPFQHCFPIAPEVSLFSAWGVLLQSTAAPSLLPTHIILYPAIILAPTFIAVL